jgi:acetyl-CoA acyltransferase 2
MAMRTVYIVGAKRTPFGKFGGSLASITATDLCVHSTCMALASANVKPEDVDSIVVGNVCSASSQDGAYSARHIALKSGMKISTPSLNINRLCGSGFQSVVSAAMEIICGDAEVAVGAGTENMSQYPFVVRDVRFGTKLGTPYNFEDTLWGSLTDQYCKLPMGITAENLAKQYKITRQQCDEYALQSQQRYAKGLTEGAFVQEIAPIEIKSRKGPVLLSADEHPKPETTIESLAKLATVFASDGTINAGNASGISDGAGSIVLASEDAVKRLNLTPLARLVAWHVEGVDPKIMGIGPVPAIRGLLKKTQLTLQDIDLIDVNEAFAPQWLAVASELNLNPDNVNVNGGAIAVGHPLAASGSRITAHLVHELRRKNLKRAIGSACIGGGQGIAILLERV